MKILADENVPFEVVEWLRQSAHDVTWIAEEQPSAADDSLLRLARAENRVVLTRDRDFGELVYRVRQEPCPVILMRMHMIHPRHRLRVLQKAWPDIERHIEGHFIVVTPGRLRVRPLDRGI